MNSNDLGKIIIALKRELEQFKAETNQRLDTLEQTAQDLTELAHVLGEKNDELIEKIRAVKDQINPSSHSMRPYDIEQAVNQQE